jgi:AcrR family transcriptional regulator
VTAAQDGVDPRPLPRGRPRDATRDEALRAAALTVLAEVGYRALTMDAVAATARAGKATIYRRWDSKLDLVIDSCNQLVSRSIPPPNTGSLSGDLREFLLAFATFLSGPAGKAAQALVGELPHEPELADAFRKSFLRSQRDVLRAVLERAESRGELAENAPLAMTVELAGAALTYRLMLTGDPLDAAFVDTLVDQILVPVLRAPRDQPPA